jgi:thiamine-phosphate pyrophosphorylase
VTRIADLLSPLPRLMFVTDATGVEEERTLDRIAAAIQGGVGIVQLRDRAARASDLFCRARILRRTFPTMCLLVNDRVDVALASEADGVQLGAGALPIAAARLLLGAGKLVGRSVHSVDEAEAAAAAGADLLVVGTMYPTASHPGKAAEGPELLSAIAAAVALPLFAIGGIDAANANECRARGAHGVAVMRAIAEAADPEQAARALCRALEADEEMP